MIWDYAGEPIAAHLLADVERLTAELEQNGPASQAFADLLSEPELQMLHHRANQALNERRLPNPPAHRRAVPWPLV